MNAYKSLISASIITLALAACAPMHTHEEPAKTAPVVQEVQPVTIHVSTPALPDSLKASSKTEALTLFNTVDLRGGSSNVITDVTKTVTNGERVESIALKRISANKPLPTTLDSALSNTLKAANYQLDAPNAKYNLHPSLISIRSFVGTSTDQKTDKLTTSVQMSFQMIRVKDNVTLWNHTVTGESIKRFESDDEMDEALATSTGKAIESLLVSFLESENLSRTLKR